MLKKSRLYFSAMCAALVLISLLITSGARACEEEPQTLLTLYMNSDLVVLARYESNGEAKKTFEDEYGYTLDTGRNLLLTKIFKGQKDLKTVSFMFSEYHPNPNQTIQENEDGEGYMHEGEDYFDVSKIKMGGEYLFFLSKTETPGEYNITDYVSGVKDLNGKSELYEKSLADLAEIAAAKENQSALLTEWIVKSIENPETRIDGISDLAESFYGLSYQDEDPIYKDKGPFVINDGYGIYTVGVAKHLTQAQKARVSAVLYPMLQEAWFAETPQYANNGISAILGGINKSRLALHAYNSLQSVGKDDVERKEMIMSFLTGVVGDETLSNLYYNYSELEIKIGEAKIVTTPEAKNQLKIMKASRDMVLKDFDKRFKFMFARHFVPVEEKKA